MKTYPESFTRDGFTLEQVERTRDVAIFSQSRPGSTQMAFEVVVLRAGKAHPKAISQEDVERYPSSEQWGHYGWTYMTLERAREKAIELLAPS